MQACILLAFLVLRALAESSGSRALAQSSGSCRTTEGRDCQGNDIKILENTSQDACCNDCAATANCGAFVYVNGGSYDKNCYLKTSCVPRACCASGTCIAGIVSPVPSPTPTPAPTPKPTSCPNYAFKGSGKALCFCQMASNPSCPGCSCSEGCTPLAGDASTVTFANFNHCSGCSSPNALLTIPRQYFYGISDLKVTCPSGITDLLASMLRAGFDNYQSLVSTRQCIHAQNAVSVPWLHLHTVCSTGSIDGMPGGSSYCGSMAAAAEAEAMAAQFASWAAATANLTMLV